MMPNIIDNFFKLFSGIFFLTFATVLFSFVIGEAVSSQTHKRDMEKQCLELMKNAQENGQEICGVCDSYVVQAAPQKPVALTLNN